MRIRSSCLALTLGTVLAAGLSACARPDFLKRDEPQAVATAQPAVEPSLTPRELLTARLINARTEDAAMPGMTVGKLIEFADRYLACDCAATRFARVWQRIDGGYQLLTNSEQVQPLRFMCSGSAEQTECYLTEIDRGSHIAILGERFMPGSDFIHFIYANGLNCQRREPCPEPAP